jgi:hypothetical protein
MVGWRGMISAIFWKGDVRLKDLENRSRKLPEGERPPVMAVTGRGEACVTGWWAG